MSYFNHAFHKLFVGTSGFDTTASLTTPQLNAQGVGNFSLFDPNTWLTPDLVPATTVSCPLVLVSSSIHPHDKIGPFHGGYAETVKSKTINPKYVSRFYRVDPCTPQNAQITIGVNQINYEDPGTCSKDFLCGETYYLRVDIKGSPVLRTLSRNTYYTADAYTGCCADESLAPTAVNPLIVYVNWAYNLLRSPLINPFIQVQITYSTDNGATWVELGDGTSSAANLALLQGYTTNPSTLPANATPEDTLAGLIINGAYVDTRFEDCTFYPNDSILAYIEPVKVYASEVDYNGDPCAFTGLCVTDVCLPVQGSGFGENAIRSLILTEGYMQQPFYTGQDLRIREITNGTDVFNAIDRTLQYTSYFIQHNVPRFNNPSGTFDNDQYLLQIVTTGTDAAFEAFMTAWLDNAGSGCTTLEVHGCQEPCTPVEACTLPGAPTVTTPVNYLVGATAIPLTATGTNLLWYTVSTGGVGSSTAPTPSTAAPGTTPYYVSQSNACGESTRATINVVVSAP